MGLGERILKTATKNPVINGAIASIGTSAYLLHEALQQFECDASLKYDTLNRLGYLTTHVLLPAIPVYLATSVLTAILKSITKEKGHRTKLSDFKTIRKLKKELRKATPPTINFTGEQKIRYGIPDLYKPDFQGLDEAARNARKTRNSAQAMYLSVKYISKGKYDEGLILLRDAIDWLEGKRPKSSLTSRPALSLFTIASAGSKLFEPCEAWNYVILAVYEAIRRPEKAWYWSSLGKMVADTFDQQRAEMYIIHSLLATAQKRTDQEQAWQETIALLQEIGKPERLGESKNPVWKLKNNEFFANTFAFKGNPNRNALEAERTTALKLEEILNGIATVPQPLYITQNEQNNLYTYVMRYLEGELLYDQLENGRKAGLKKVIPVLARILARYPTAELPRVSITEKTAKKLKSLGMPSAYKYFQPVIEDLEMQKIWAANKDAHPEQWQIINHPGINEKVGVLDAEIKEIQPIVLDFANLLYYNGEFTREEREKRVYQLIDEIRKEGANNPKLAHAYEGENRLLLRAVDNAAIFRMLCLLEAWDESRPKMHSQRERLVKTALESMKDLREHDPKFYTENEQDYDKLKERIPELLNAT
ncbi:hypothetical protein KY319_02850 [Candidatus Woesearchaeota archaeon]|nr:hypothetical protein [Candidatus Woesearchaeota archaeon]